MADKNDPKPSARPAQTREDRLKAALKANLARRKTQSRKRKQDTGATETQPGSTGQNKDA